MRGVSIWLLMFVLTAGCGASVTHIGGPDASTPDHVNLQVDWVGAYRPA